MTRSTLATSRTRLLAFALVALFAAGSLVSLQSAAAADLSSAKRCKKGYTKVKGRCKKKKSAPKARSVELTLVGFDGINLHASGKFILSKPAVNNRASNLVTIEYVTPTSTITHKVRSTRTDFSMFPFSDSFEYSGAFPVQITAKVDGKVSKTLTVEN